MECPLILVFMRNQRARNADAKLYRTQEFQNH